MMKKMAGLCLNWKIIAGLVALGLGIAAVAPNLLWAALPLLVVAACPLSMLLMMRGMQGGQCAAQPDRESQPGNDAGLTREEQLAELKAQLTTLQTQHQAIAQAIIQLEVRTGPAGREAAAVLHGAGERDLELTETAARE